MKKDQTNLKSRSKKNLGEIEAIVVPDEKDALDDSGQALEQTNSSRLAVATEDGWRERLVWKDARIVVVPLLHQNGKGPGGLCGDRETRSAVAQHWRSDEVLQDSLLRSPAHGETRHHRLGPDPISICRFARRCACQASV